MLEIDHFDLKKSARVVRVFREMKDRSGKSSFPLGIELVISNDGDDQGLVIGIGFSILKMEATEYKEKSDVKWTQHTVRSKWKKFNSSNGAVIVPVEVEQRYANSSSGTVTGEQSIVYTWKDFDENLKVPTLDQFRTETVGDIQSRIDKKLNR